LERGQPLFIMKTKSLKSVLLLIISLTLFSCSSDSDETSAPTPEPPKTKVRITSYKIDAMPFTTTNNLGWDGINGNPDVYTGLFNNNVLFHTSNVLNDVPSNSLPIGESFASPYYLITNLSNTIDVIVMDNDVSPDSDDLIGSVTFVMNDYTTGTNKYPPMVSKLNNGVIVSLNLIWE
jgi:hypothetical protein